MAYNMTAEFYEPDFTTTSLFSKEDENAANNLLSEIAASSSMTNPPTYTPSNITQLKKRKRANEERGNEETKKQKPKSIKMYISKKNKDSEVKPNYEDMSQTIRSIDASLGNLAQLPTSTLSERMLADIDMARQLLQTATAELKKNIEEVVCLLCRRSPTSHPLIVRGACGHSFCCLSCLTEYISTTQSERGGVFQCMRCDKTGSITLLQQQ